MPEGDTIARIAARLAPLVGVPLAIATPHPRHAHARIPERLAGALVDVVETRGKHLLVRFDNGLVLHSHLRLTGRWDIHPSGAAWARGRHRAWLVLGGAGIEAVEFDGPVLELLTPAQVALHPVLSRLGADALDADLDVVAAAARARRGDGARPIGDVLLDQRVLAGIGNVWKSEALFGARIDPRRRTAAVADEELARAIDEAATRMRDHVARGDGRRPVAVYGRAGRPCPACGTAIVAQPLGDAGRITFWCPRCQH